MFACKLSAWLYDMRHAISAMWVVPIYTCGYTPLAETVSQQHLSPRNLESQQYQILILSSSTLSLLLELLHGVVGSEGWNGFEPAKQQLLSQIGLLNDTQDVSK